MTVSAEIDQQFQLAEAAMRAATLAHVDYHKALNCQEWTLAAAIQTEIVGRVEVSLDLLAKGYRLAAKAGYDGRK